MTPEEDYFLGSSRWWMWCVYERQEVGERGKESNRGMNWVHTRKISREPESCFAFFFSFSHGGIVATSDF